MQMWRCASTCRPDVADDLSLLNDLAVAYREAGQMAVSGRQPIAMADYDQIAVVALTLREDYDSVRGRIDRSAPDTHNIDAHMVVRGAGERVSATAESAAD